MWKLFRTAAALLLAATVAVPAMAQTLTVDHRHGQGRARRRASRRHRDVDRQTGSAQTQVTEANGQLSLPRARAV